MADSTVMMVLIPVQKKQVHMRILLLQWSGILNWEAECSPFRKIYTSGK